MDIITPAVRHAILKYDSFEQKDNLLEFFIIIDK